MKALALIPLAALVACGEPETIVLTPPPALLTCKPAPAVPEILPPQGSIERERATLELWLAERDAGADCRANLAGVKAWIAEVSD